MEAELPFVAPLNPHQIDSLRLYPPICWNLSARLPEQAYLAAQPEERTEADSQVAGSVMAGRQELALDADLAQASAQVACLEIQVVTASSGQASCSAETWAGAS